MPDASGHPQRSYVCATPYLENAPHLPHSVTEPPDTLTVKVRSVKGAQRPVHRSGPKQRHQTETVIYKFIINTKIAMKALKQRASVVRLGRKEWIPEGERNIDLGGSLVEVEVMKPWGGELNECLKGEWVNEVPALSSWWSTGGGKWYVVLNPRIRLQRREENLANMTSVQVIKLQVSKAVVQSISESTRSAEA